MRMPWLWSKRKKERLSEDSTSVVWMCLRVYYTGSFNRQKTKPMLDYMGIRTQHTNKLYYFGLDL